MLRVLQSLHSGLFGFGWNQLVLARVERSLLLVIEVT